MTRKGFKLGELFGITIRVDWSWVLIFLLTTWNLATLFGNLHGGWGIGLRWGTAVVAALLFFGSVLAHELAHALVAQARGIPVRNITLFIFGGVSNIQREPDSPGSEFWMAILGPVASLVIGAGLLVLTALGAGLTQEMGQDPSEVLSAMGPLATIFLWLGTINLSLGLFNLIPGFPLDGGRVLRSILWSITDNLRRATRWAATVGQGIAWLMIIAGIAMTFGARLPLLGEGVGDGLWLAFIGWFLHNASSNSYRQLLIEDVLEDVPVARMMQKEPLVVSPDLTISELVDQHIMGSDEHAFPVMDGGSLAGIICLEDVRAVEREARERVTVREAMTPAPDLVTVSPEDDAAASLKALARRDVRQLPVLREGALVGLLRRRDIVKWLQLESDLNLG